MPRRCSVCSSERRRAVEIGIAAGFTAAALSRDYSLGEDAIRRHAKAHLPTRLVDAETAQETVEATGLYAQTEHLHNRAVGLLDTAEEAGDLRVAVNAIHAAKACLQLSAQMRATAVVLDRGAVPTDPTDEQVEWARKVLTARIEREDGRRHGWR